MPRPTAPRRLRALALAGAVLTGGMQACAQVPTRTPAPAAAPASSAASVPGPAAEPPTHSALDAPLFYQLLIGEMELRGGEPGRAYQVLLDAARRTRDDTLFRRAVEVAIQARAGEDALVAARAWRQSRPQSAEAARFEVQLLMALKRSAEVAQPLEALLANTPVGERSGLIASLPRFLQGATDRKASAQMLDGLLRPHLDVPFTRTAARVALGRAWLAAGEPQRALELAQRAAADDPEASGPALLALELMPGNAAAEALVASHVAHPKAETAVRLAYASALTQANRYADAVVQLQKLTREQPTLAPPWLTLGALLVELRQPAEAEAALQRFVELHQAAPAPKDEDHADADDGALVQAWLLLAQASEQRGDFAGAERWLGRIDSPQRALEVTARRAVLLARQGQVRQARELVKRVPERQPDDTKAKLLAEAQVLREVKHWTEAYEVLGSAVARFADDADLLYEQSMMAEKLGRLDDMERQLRRVLELKPDHHHAYNALGYSLADRGLRLPEARDLIRKALELAPNDPFITDSLGWVEFRMGNRDEAARLLRRAHAARPDVEIAAHLGEVLWSMGQHDEARRVWRDARQRDAANEVLRETLARLKVDL